MMNKFESRWFNQWRSWNETSHLYFSAAEQISLVLQNTTTKANMVLLVALSAVDAAKQFYKIIWSEKNFNRFYDKTVTTAEEHNNDPPESTPYLRLQIENGS